MLKEYFPGSLQVVSTWNWDSCPLVAFRKYTHFLGVDIRMWMWIWRQTLLAGLNLSELYLTWCCYVAGDGVDAEQPVPAAAGQPQQDRHRPDELEHHGAAQQEAATQVQYSTVQFSTVQPASTALQLEEDILWTISWWDSETVKWKEQKQQSKGCPMSMTIDPDFHHSCSK